VNDADVTLTDFGLTLLCVFLTWRSLQTARSPVRGWLAIFFSAAAAASLFGGTVHGFAADEATIGHAVLWPATLLAVGGTAVAAWGIGARIGSLARQAHTITWLAILSYLGFAIVVLTGHQRFQVAVAYYVPAALFLFGSLLIEQRARPTRARKLALSGLALTFIAAATQQLQIGLHPVYFDYNALYHVLQAVALTLFYRGAREE
jgi:hypothetical protein